MTFDKLSTIFGCRFDFLYDHLNWSHFKTFSCIFCKNDLHFNSYLIPFTVVIKTAVLKYLRKKLWIHCPWIDQVYFHFAMSNQVIQFLGNFQVIVGPYPSIANSHPFLLYSINPSTLYLDQIWFYSKICNLLEFFDQHYNKR